MTVTPRLRQTLSTPSRGREPRAQSLPEPRRRAGRPATSESTAAQPPVQRTPSGDLRQPHLTRSTPRDTNARAPTRRTTSSSLAPGVALTGSTSLRFRRHRLTLKSVDAAPQGRNSAQTSSRASTRRPHLRPEPQPVHRAAGLRDRDHRRRGEAPIRQTSRARSTARPSADDSSPSNRSCTRRCHHRPVPRSPDGTPDRDHTTAPASGSTSAPRARAHHARDPLSPRRRPTPLQRA